MTKLFPFVFLLLSFSLSSEACTIAIISGKHTPDGRPILWKHRDTGVFDNKVIIYEGGTYRAAGLINSADDHPARVYIGFNEAGFAIMNSASYNLFGDDSLNIPSMTGHMMRDALLECATVDDFERFLQEYDKPKGVETNYGVIDVHGNAAFFETDHFGYTRIDVDDQRVAPHGYLIRTNFSYTGIPHEGAGYIRYETAQRLFYRASGSNNLSVQHIMEHMATSVWNSYSGQDARNAIHLKSSEDKFMYFHDCINRFTSSSSVAIQGVRPGESPLLTTMWTRVGFPLASVVVPVWLTPQHSLPAVITAPGKENAPIGDWALQLKDEMVPSKRGSTKYYINATRVFNADGTGITQQLLPVSREILKATERLMKNWEYPPQEEVNQHYDWIDAYITEQYRTLFGIPEKL
ncbi:MAG: carcinine hydrolase/isopenicillin-N N-acyltransferase family protein [Bacteroidales bacterium]|nr:carcinine hydrolase/isopenicillin-N N-acyltransferase family protein [Bacteroidales bacterium]